ncbi:hypothetical protein MWN34_09440 [Ancylobacter sp. 6x-1]|uniref:Uncharacterized protein n=1 Tax=Ancylobacter crimeensis TaxID=2579147 RepID=A0ABT0DB83_9HYPH|nr:hypothetical protein [Ancylobacter crimeensis]MCK0197134.1 hypothetical protein [Ancylobacter crimeensis]
MGWNERAARIRRELAQSKKRAGYLPDDNPYKVAPRWMPIWLALLVAAILRPSPPRR